MTEDANERSTALSRNELTVLGVGLVGGAAFGAVTLALSGEVLAMSIMPGFGLLVALIYISLQRRKGMQTE